MSLNPAPRWSLAALSFLLLAGAPPALARGPLAALRLEKPSIAAQPADQAVLVGQKATFRVTAKGTPPLLYQWRKDGQRIRGAVSASYTTRAATLADDGAVFTVEVRNLLGKVTSQPATLRVSPPPVAPAIASAPQGQVVVEGQAATFSVEATGTAPLAYQWSRDGAAIPGATAAAYTTPPASLSDSGAAFAVTVTNVAGAVTSAPATLTVTPAPKPPAITAAPHDQVVTEGDAATFTVVATGDEPLSYQWSRDGAAIPGAVAASYTTPILTRADDGATFTVAVTNAAGSAATEPVTLHVTPRIETAVLYQAGVLAEGWAPQIWSGCSTPDPLATFAGGTVLSFDLTCGSGWDAGVLGHWADTFDLSPYDTLSFDIGAEAAAGMDTLVIWFQDAAHNVPVGPLTPGQLNHVIVSLGDLGLPGSAINQFGWFSASPEPGPHFYLDNVAFTGSSGPTAPTIVTPPVDQVVAEGQRATFSVLAAGTGPLAYQWSKDGTPIPGATGRGYTTGAAAAGDSGARFTVTVTNAVGSVTSAPAVLTVQADVTLSYVYRAGLLGDGWSAGVWSGCGTGNPDLATPFAGAVTAGFDLRCSAGWDAGVFGHWSAPFDLSAYDTLSFDVGALDATNMGALVVWFDGAGVQVPVGTPPAGQLAHVTVPLAQLGLPATTVQQFGFFNASGSPGPWFVVDNVAFTGPASAGTTIPCQGDCGAVTFTVDVAQGPTERAAGPLPVSPYVYGINPASGDLDRATRFGAFRAGGNAFSAWNWTNNYRNSGADYCFWQGLATNGSAPAAEISWIPAASEKGIASLITVPIGDYVSARVDNQTWPACNSVPANTNVNEIPFAPSSYFVANRPTKGGALCAYPGPNGEAGDCAIDPTASVVYQDEFVNYVKRWWVDGKGATVFLSLDNEPNYWMGTHPQIWSNPALTYDEAVNRDRTYAAALKAVWPEGKIFGPVVAQDGIVFAHDYSREDEFLDYYLPRMSGLLDVLDVHYYNNSTDPATCLQNPRAFWDPTYTVPNNQDGMDYVAQYHLPDYAHRRMIPRLLDKVAAAGMDPVPGLAFTEYDSGCEGDIAGGVAQAEVLGLFGRYGVYAGMAWFVGRDLGSDYAGVAFDAYRNYDGAGATVGDLAVAARTSDDVDTSVYAYTHAGDPGQMELVALNKTTTRIPVHATIATPASFTRAAVYRLVRSATVAVAPAPGAPPAVTCDGSSCALDYVLEPLSVATIVLR